LTDIQQFIYWIYNYIIKARLGNFESTRKHNQSSRALRCRKTISYPTASGSALLMENEMKALKPNMIVAVYDDPLTRTRLQCNVILVEKTSQQFVNQNLECWIVKSSGLSFTNEFEAIINIADACE